MEIDQRDSEILAADAFSKQAVIFDELYAANTIINYKRGRVRQHVLKYLSGNSHILELNSGTGEDALFFAGMGHKVHATDISTGMQEVLKSKVDRVGMNGLISTEICSYTQLASLTHQIQYDAIYSNFGGLNCTDKLNSVLLSLPALLKPGGTVTLVIIPEFCLWEFLLVFKGHFKTAFRRFFSRNGRTAHIEGQYFKCWYYNPSRILKHTKQQFEMVSLEGLCTIVPPSYIEGFAEKYPVTYLRLKKWEDQLKGTWPWKLIGDYYIITLRKK